MAPNQKPKIMTTPLSQILDDIEALAAAAEQAAIDAQRAADRATMVATEAANRVRDELLKIINHVNDTAIDAQETANTVGKTLTLLTSGLRGVADLVDEKLAEKFTFKK